MLDGSGHAASIEDTLDDIEIDLKRRSTIFMKEFDVLYRRAVEMPGYMRTGLVSFPALDFLNNQADLKMRQFMEFLKEIECLVSDKRALGTIQPIVPDHMYREECYYLTKLSWVSNIPKLECDPGKPRVQA